MKKFLTIFGLIVLGLILRLISINKAEGLWNDEYISWMISATPFNNGFFSAIRSQCHMPLYYFYLKFVMTIFGQSDIVLRLSSVFTGLCAIPVMYFAGKENDERTGILCAFFTSISSFLIYYSQEVRLYSLLFLISALTFLFTLKLIKQPDKKNIILSVLFNFLIIFTHTIGFVFVFFNLIFISVNLFKKYKKILIYLWTIIFVLLISISPLIIKIFTTKSFSQWWGHFTISKICYMFTDYFSPVLVNLTNAPDKFIFTPVMLITGVIAVCMLFKAIWEGKKAGRLEGKRLTVESGKLKVESLSLHAPSPDGEGWDGVISLNNEETPQTQQTDNNLSTLQPIITYPPTLQPSLFALTACLITVLAIASMMGKLVFITKYSIEIYPILIFLFCTGILAIQNKIFRNILLITYFTLSIGYLILSPISAPRLPRLEGHKLVTDTLKNMDLKKGDFILIEYYPQSRFEKYFDFSDYNVISINKGNFPEYLLPDMTYEKTYTNGKRLYKNMFLKGHNDYYEGILKKEIFYKIKPEQNLVTITLDSVATYNPELIQKIAGHDTAYEKTPLLFLIFSYIKYENFYDIINVLDFRGNEKHGSWTIIKFTKLNK